MVALLYKTILEMQAISRRLVDLTLLSLFLTEMFTYSSIF